MYPIAPYLDEDTEAPRPLEHLLPDKPPWYIPWRIAKHTHLVRDDWGLVLRQNFTNNPFVPTIEQLGERYVFPVTESPFYKVIPLMVLSTLWLVIFTPYVWITSGSSALGVVLFAVGCYILYRTWYAAVRRRTSPLLARGDEFRLFDYKIYQPGSDAIQSGDATGIVVSYPWPSFFWKIVKIGTLTVVRGEKDKKNTGDDLVIRGVGTPGKVERLLSPIQKAAEKATRETPEIIKATRDEIRVLRGEVTALHATQIETLDVLRGLASTVQVLVREVSRLGQPRELPSAQSEPAQINGTLTGPPLDLPAQEPTRKPSPGSAALRRRAAQQQATSDGSDTGVTDGGNSGPPDSHE